MMKSVIVLFSLMSALISKALSQTLYQATSLNVNGFGGEIEGACFDSKGNFYAVNYGGVQGNIGKVLPTLSTSLHLSLPTPALLNGIRFDQKGNMFAADVGGSRVIKVTPSGSISTFCTDPAMLYGVPNDLEMTSNGNIFLSGQNWGRDLGEIWRCSPTGVATRLASMRRTNGITVSPDESILYVSEAQNLYGSPVSNKIWQWDLSATGDISNQRLLIDFTQLGSGSVDVDGMRTDIAGNLYVTRNGGGQVLKISPNGQILQTIQLTFQYPSNLDFGGSDGMTIYVVGRCSSGSSTGCINTFRVDKPGRSYQILHSGQDMTSSQSVMTTASRQVITTSIKTTGIQTTAVQSTGIQTTGIQTTGIHTTGIHTTGIHTTGIQTTGIHTTAAQTTAIQTTSPATSASLTTQAAVVSTSKASTASLTSSSPATTSKATTMPATSSMASTTSPSPSSSSTTAAASSCTLGYMKCSGTSLYDTCVQDAKGNGYWGATRSCGSRTCSNGLPPYQNYVYCV